tara:strand:+ start:530 stop:982 length:453 start_codon:yes stop_codon:yes gene_type:complete
MEEEDHTQENKNLTEEQIIQLGEYAGVKPKQTYCNMNNVFTNFVYLLSVLLGRPTESRTMNFDCFKRVFEELPADSFDRLNKTMKGIDDLMKASKADIEAKHKAQTQRNRAENKLDRLRRQANRERAMTDILRFALLEKMDLDEEFYDLD